MAAVIVVDTKVTKRKDMENKFGPKGTVTLDSTLKVNSTVMEYTDGKMDQYIMESGNRARKMDTDIISGKMAMNIGENGKIS